MCTGWGPPRDFIVADTTAASYLAATATVAGSATESVAGRKETKNKIRRSNRYQFFSIAIEAHTINKATSFLLVLG